MIERSHVRFAGRPYEPSHKLAKGKVRLAPASLHVMAMFGPGVSVHVKIGCLVRGAIRKIGCLVRGAIKLVASFGHKIGCFVWPTHVPPQY